MAKVNCPQCNYSVNVDLEQTNDDPIWIMCPTCGNSFKYSRPDKDIKSEQRYGTPWERRMELGLWQGIFHTVKSTMFSPKKMYSAMPVKGGLMEPLTFGLLIGSIGSMLSFFYDFLFSTFGFKNSLEGIGILFNSPVNYLYFIFLSPLLVIIELFLSSFIAHLLLVIMRGNKNKFEATFRVFAYSQAAMICCIIPFIGSTVAKLWMTVVQITGLKEAHGISYTRIIIALMIPFLFIVIAFGLLLFFLKIIIT